MILWVLAILMLGCGSKQRVARDDVASVAEEDWDLVDRDNPAADGRVERFSEPEVSYLPDTLTLLAHNQSKPLAPQYSFSLPRMTELGSDQGPSQPDSSVLLDEASASQEDIIGSVDEGGSTDILQNDLFEDKIEIMEIIEIEETTPFDVSEPQQPFVCWSDSFEWDENPGWDWSGLWHRISVAQDIVNIFAGPPYNYVILAGSPEISKPKDGKYAFWYGQDENGSYILEPAEEQTAGGGTSAEPHEGELVSPWIDLSNTSRVTLFFWSWWEIESKHPVNYDLSTVEVTTNGYDWIEVGRLNPSVIPQGASPYLAYTVNGLGMPPSWHRKVIALDKFVGSFIRIRFRFRSNDVFYNAFRGWVVDQVWLECVR